MIDDCQKFLEPNFDGLCCLRHLIEMSRLSEARMIPHRYFDFLLHSFHKQFQKSLSTRTNMFIANNSLDLTLSLMSIMSKCVAFFFSSYKFKYAKFISKVSLRLIKTSLYKAHPQVLLSASAIHMNLAAVYIKQNKWDKALSEMNSIKPLMITDMDKLIFYNNYVKIYSTAHKDSNDLVAQGVLSSIYLEMKKLILDLIYNIKNEYLKEKTINKEDDINVIAFICYNYGIQMEKIGNLDEAKFMYKSGYEFGLCLLSQKDYLIDKYENKVRMFSLNKVEDDSNSNLNSEDDGVLITEENVDEVNLNTKLECVMSKLDNITERLNNGDISEKEHIELVKQAEQIRQMINNINSNDETMETPKLNEKISPKAITSKKTQIVCKEKNETHANINECNTSEIDLKSKKFYSSDDNNSVIDFHPNMGEVNLLDIDSHSESNSSIKAVKKKNAFQMPTVTKPKLQIHIDAVEEEPKYECVTFYQKAAVIAPGINIHLDNTKNDDYKCETYYTKFVGHLTREIISSKSNLSLDIFYGESKFQKEFFKQNVFTFDINSFFDKLTKPSLSTRPIIAVRFIKNEKFLLSLVPINDGINLSLKTPTGTITSSIKFDYDKLRLIMKKILIHISLRPFQIFNMIKTMNDFTSNCFVNFISCRFQDGYKFGISPVPIGAFLKKTINIRVRHVLCSFDILVFDKNTARILVSSNDNYIIFIDAEFDDKSFDLIFEKEKIKGNIYSLRAEDYATDTNIISIGKNVQKLLNAFCINRFNTFDDMCSCQSLVFSMKITNECKEGVLFCSEFTDKLFKVISVSTDSQKKDEGIIYSSEIKNLFGLELKDLFIRTNQQERTFISQIVLSSVELNYATDKLTLMEFTEKEKFNFYKNNKAAHCSFVDINGIQFIKMIIYTPIAQMEHVKLLVVNGKVKETKFKFDKKSKEKIKKIFDKTLCNIIKGNDCYIEEIEM